MRKNELKYLGIFFIFLVFLAPVIIGTKGFWSKDSTLTSGSGLWASRDSAPAPIASSSTEHPRAWMPPVANSPRAYGKEGGLYGEKIGEEYGEETEGTLGKEKQDSGPLGQKGLGEDEIIAGVPTSSEKGGQGAEGNAGSGEGISGIGGATLSPLASLKDSSTSGSSSIGGAGNPTVGNKRASVGVGSDGGKTSALNPSKKVASSGGKLSSANSAQMQTAAASEKSNLPTFNAGSLGQSGTGASGASGASGTSEIGPGDPRGDQAGMSGGGGSGIGGAIAAPDTGPGVAADTGATEADVKADNCAEIYAGCTQIYRDYDRSIQNTEAELQQCYTMVNLGKGGIMKVVDQECFNRVNAKLLALRADRDNAAKECQKGQDTCGR